MRKRKRKENSTVAGEQILFDHLCDAIRKTGIEIRVEKGNFRGGVCLINGDSRVLFLNKKNSLEKNNNLLINHIKKMDYEQLYLPPLLREKIEKIQHSK